MFDPLAQLTVAAVFPASESTKLVTALPVKSAAIPTEPGPPMVHTLTKYVTAPGTLFHLSVPLFCVVEMGVMTTGSSSPTVPLTGTVTEDAPVELSVTLPFAVPTDAPDSWTFSVPPAVGKVFPVVPIGHQLSPPSTENSIAPVALTPMASVNAVPVTVTLPSPPAVPAVVDNPLTLAGDTEIVGVDDDASQTSMPLKLMRVLVVLLVPNPKAKRTELPILEPWS